MLKTVHPMDSYYAKSSQTLEYQSIRVLKFQSSRVVEFWSSRLVVRRMKETMWLQLMCCPLSDFSSSQFTRGQIRGYGTERKS